MCSLDARGLGMTSLLPKEKKKSASLTRQVLLNAIRTWIRLSGWPADPVLAERAHADGAPSMRAQRIMQAILDAWQG